MSPSVWTRVERFITYYIGGLTTISGAQIMLREKGSKEAGKDSSTMPALTQSWEMYLICPGAKIKQRSLEDRQITGPISWENLWAWWEDLATSNNPQNSKRNKKKTLIQTCRALQQEVIQLQTKIKDQELEMETARKDAQDKIANEELEVVAFRK